MTRAARKKSQAAKNAVSNRDVTPNLQDFFLSSRPYAGHFCLTAHISRALKCFAAHSQNGLPLVFWCLLSVLFIIIWCIYVQKLSDETVPHYFFEFSVLLLLPTDKSFAVSFFAISGTITFEWHDGLITRLGLFAILKKLCNALCHILE